MIEGSGNGEIRVAVVGCGAMTETRHLPALGRSLGRRVAALVDRAIVAVPPRVHAPISQDLMRAGIPVLVEKPVALGGGLGSVFPQERESHSGVASRELLPDPEEGDEVVYVEPIPLGRRVRDMAETADGRLLLWGDDGWFIARQETGSAQRASLIRFCLSCHVIGGAGQQAGPELTGVVG